MGETRNLSTFTLKNFKKKDNLGDLDEDGKVT
jgi:hypothetical protein